MDYRRLGNSGAIVTAWCLGTMTFGKEADEATSFAIMDAYVKAGGNFFDTADVYSNGVSETIVGRWLKARPDEARQVVVATKGRFPTGEGPNDIGLSRRHLGVALDGSLKRLGVERIDLYQMHAWDGLTPLEETLRSSTMRCAPARSATTDSAITWAGRSPRRRRWRSGSSLRRR